MLSQEAFECFLAGIIVNALIVKGVTYDPPDAIVDAAIKIAKKIVKKYS